MRKVCCIFNTPSLYREQIFKRIDRDYDCYWYFEDTDNKLEVFDTSCFKNITQQHSITFGPFYWVRGVVSLLWKKDFDLYLMMGHSRNLSTVIFLLFKKLFFSRKKAFLWTHGLYGKESRLEKLWKGMLYKSADGIILYGNYAYNLMLKSGIKPEKMSVIHNSLNYDIQLQLRKQLKPTSINKDFFKNNYPTLIYIGRLNPVKKLDMIITSLYHLKKKGQMFNFVFVGDGPEKEKLQNKANELGVSNQIWFYGACYDEKINAEMIFNADLCVSPGNVGLTSMHSLMFGCPVVTHNDFTLQMPEFESIHEGITGDFFSYGNQKSLGDTISRWFSNKNYDRESIRRACYSEIDTQWNPEFQMKVIKKVLG